MGRVLQPQRLWLLGYLLHPPPLAEISGFSPRPHPRFWYCDSDPDLNLLIGLSGNAGLNA